MDTSAYTGDTAPPTALWHVESLSVLNSHTPVQTSPVVLHTAHNSIAPSFKRRKPTGSPASVMLIGGGNSSSSPSPNGNLPHSETMHSVVNSTSPSSGGVCGTLHQNEVNLPQQVQLVGLEGLQHTTNQLHIESADGVAHAQEASNSGTPTAVGSGANTTNGASVTNSPTGTICLNVCVTKPNTVASNTTATNTTNTTASSPSSSNNVGVGANNGNTQILMALSPYADAVSQETVDSPVIIDNGFVKSNGDISNGGLPSLGVCVDSTSSSNVVRGVSGKDILSAGELMHCSSSGEHLLGSQHTQKMGIEGLSSSGALTTPTANIAAGGLIGGKGGMCIGNEDPNTSDSVVANLRGDEGLAGSNSEEAAQPEIAPTGKPSGGHRKSKKGGSSGGSSSGAAHSDQSSGGGSGSTIQKRSGVYDVPIGADGQTATFAARKGVYFDKTRKLWRANWKENGRIQTKGFSVNEYGTHDIARQKAIEFREKKESELEVYKKQKDLQELKQLLEEIKGPVENNDLHLHDEDVNDPIVCEEKIDLIEDSTGEHSIIQSLDVSAISSFEPEIEEHLSNPEKYLIMEN